jgi:cyanophycinase-like exopeptidase
MRSTASALPALGWLERTVIEATFQPQNDTMLRRLMSLPEVRLGVGIPPRTAIAAGRNGETTILGSDTVAVFRKN